MKITPDNYLPRENENGKIKVRFLSNYTINTEFFGQEISQEPKINMSMQTVRFKKLNRFLYPNKRKW